MTDFGPALLALGLAAQDWGPTYNSDYASLAANWRGSVPCPTEVEVNNALFNVTSVAGISQAKANAAEAYITNSAFANTIIDAILDLENRIRALEGLPAVTRNEVRNDLKVLYIGNI